MSEFILVKCSRCGEFTRVTPELIGDAPIAEIEESYLCGECEKQDDPGEDFGYYDWKDEIEDEI